MCVWLSVTLCERQSPIHSTLTYSMKSDHITSPLSIPSFCLAPGGVTNTTITTTHIPTERTPLGHPPLPPHPLILIVLTSFYAMLSRLLVLLVFIIIFVSATPFPNSQRHTDGRTDKRTDGQQGENENCGDHTNCSLTFLDQICPCPSTPRYALHLEKHLSILKGVIKWGCTSFFFH
ncbi:hypothetical protein F5H01DRAFT_334478 [Linnemannia elongata]|nr:hypothetical protein F5H01DRAFT_334478 [Linnemannia elongata]